jgi:hypothetical protein
VPDRIASTFKAYATTGEGWRDSAGNGSVADAAERSFFIEGPVVRLESPGAGGQIDIGTLRSRGYIDITWTIAASGFTLDPASITDLAPEFTLTGAGLGSVKLDGGQAPVLIGQLGNDYTYRYWTTGAYATGDPANDGVTVESVAGSWSFTKDGADPVPRPPPQQPRARSG